MSLGYPLSPSRFWKKNIEVTTVEKWNNKLKEWEDEISAKFVLFPKKK